MNARWCTFAATLLVILLLGAAEPAVAESARTEDGESARFVTLINDVRAERGLEPLRRSSALDEVARRWTDAMIDERDISHNPDLHDWVDEVGLTDWTALGENVGFGRDVDALMEDFIESDPHYAVIINAKIAWVGVATGRGPHVCCPGWEALYTSHQFMAYDGVPPGHGPAGEPRPTTSTTRQPTTPQTTPPASDAERPSEPAPTPSAAPVGVATATTVTTTATSSPTPAGFDDAAARGGEAIVGSVGVPRADTIGPDRPARVRPYLATLRTLER